MSIVKIMCPKCDWEPSPNDMWICTCGNIWHTFDTGGRCPSCGILWEQTRCHEPFVGGCSQWSPHIEWYRNLDKWVKKEVESIDIRILQPD